MYAIFPSVAHAAACPAGDGGYGSVSGSVNIQSTGSYRVWSRLRANVVGTAHNDSFWLIIDGGTCFNVGDASSIAAGQWIWIDWQDSATTSKINFNFASAGNHTIKLLGREANVQVDRVIFTTDTTSSACNPPTGNGDSCAVNSPTLTPTPTLSSGGTTSGGSSSGGTVSSSNGGSVTLPTVPGSAPVTVSGGTKGTVSSINGGSASVPQVAGIIAVGVEAPVPDPTLSGSTNLTKQEITVIDTKIYDTRGKLLAQGTGKVAVDTTKLLDGVQQLKIVTQTSDGKKSSQIITIKVYNYYGFWRHAWYMVTNPWRKLTNAVGV